MNRYFLFALTVLFCNLAGAQQRVSINPDQHYHTIESFGVADAWSGNFVGKLDHSSLKI